MLILLRIIMFKMWPQYSRLHRESSMLKDAEVRGQSRPGDDLHKIISATEVESSYKPKCLQTG